MLNNFVARTAALVVLAASAVAAQAQSQPDLAAAANAATTAVPGFIYKVQLKLTITNRLIWETKINTSDSKTFRVNVNATTNAVSLTRQITFDPRTPLGAGLNVVQAQSVALNAVAARGDQGSLVEAECRTRSNGTKFWKVELASLTTDGLFWEVKMDAATGKVFSVQMEDAEEED